MGFAICILQLAFTPPAFAQPDPPVLGRPKDFSGLVGQYSISASATPTQVRVEEPITLTVRITTFDPKSQPPERSRLHLFPDDFSKNFYVEETESKHPWEFVYRLRPKHADVKLVPSLKLVYYHPGRQKYQATYSDAIDLWVTQSRRTVNKTGEWPTFLFDLPSAEELLAPAPRPLATNHELVSLLFVGPPALGLICYVVSRRLRGFRRGVASNTKLGTRILGELRKPDIGLADSAKLVAEYLREGTRLQIESPTPSEVDRHLGILGVSRPARRKCAALFDQYAEAMFAPPRQRGFADLKEAAIQSILALESESCLRW